MILSFKNIKKSNLGRDIFDGVSLVLKEGQIVLVEGEVSSGKTLFMDMANNYTSYKKGLITKDFSYSFYLRATPHPSDFSLTVFEYLFSKLHSGNYELFKKIYDVNYESQGQEDENNFTNLYEARGGYFFEEFIEQITNQFELDLDIREVYLKDLRFRELSLLNKIILRFIDFPEYFVSKVSSKQRRSRGMIFFLDMPEYYLDDQDIDFLLTKIKEKIKSSCFVFCTNSIRELVEISTSILFIDKSQKNARVYNCDYETFFKLRLEERLKDNHQKSIDMKEVDRLHTSALNTLKLMEKNPASKEEQKHGKISFRRANKAFVKITNTASVLRNRAKKIADKISHNELRIAEGKVNFLFPSNFLSNFSIQVSDFDYNNEAVEVFGNKYFLNTYESLEKKHLSNFDLSYLFLKSLKIDNLEADYPKVNVVLGDGFESFVFGGLESIMNLSETNRICGSLASMEALDFLRFIFRNDFIKTSEIIEVCNSCGFDSDFQSTTISKLSSKSLLQLELIIFSLKSQIHFLILNVDFLDRYSYNKEMFNSLTDIFENFASGLILL